jgi:UDP-N-acetyl-D-mannosaminuronate dehydrogenase
MENVSGSVTLVVGLGEVGKPLFTILKKQGLEVVGIDIEPVCVERPVGIMHICLPFKDPGQFRSSVASYARKYRPQVIVVNSTVVPGTSRALEKEFGIPCVSSPIRGKHTKMVDDLFVYVKFVAGANPEATERVRAQFRAAGLQSETISTPETLELAKLLETTYFGLLIAWAQEMNRFAGSVNADYLEVGKFFREISYLPGVLFQPGFIGGHCVLPNVGILQQRFQSEFLDAIMHSNEARKVELDAQQAQRTSEPLQPLALA